MGIDVLSEYITKEDVVRLLGCAHITVDMSQQEIIRAMYSTPDVIEQERRVREVVLYLKRKGLDVFAPEHRVLRKEIADEVGYDWCKRGRWEDIMGNTELAQRLYTIARCRSHPVAAAHAAVSLGALYYEQRKYTEAEKIWKETEHYGIPELTAQAAVNLGALYYEQRKYTEAEKIWKEVEHYDVIEQTARAVYKLGALCYGAKRYEEAKKYVFHAMYVYADLDQKEDIIGCEDLLSLIEKAMDMS